MPAPPLGAEPAIVSATGFLSGIHARQFLNSLEGVGLRGGFVGAIPFDAREPQRKAARVRGADLNPVEGDFHSRLRAEQGEAALFSVARTQVQIAQPALPASMTPFRREDDQIESTRPLDLEPA